MEEDFALIKGIMWELTFFLHSFFLGFCFRMGYDIFVLLRIFFPHKRWQITGQDFLFWCSVSIVLFGLLFKENNGTPRLFSIAGVLLGMFLYQIGPGEVIARLARSIKRKLIRYIKKKKNSRQVLKMQKKNDKIEIKR